MTEAESFRLDLLERAAVAEEIGSVLQDELRARMSVILNAAGYVRGRLADTPLAAFDTRIDQSLHLVEEEVGDVEKLLAERMSFCRHFKKYPSKVLLSAAIELGVERFRARVPSPPPIESLGGDHAAVVCPLDLALAIDALLHNASEAAPGQPIRITRGSDDRDAWIAVTDCGPGIAAADRDRVFAPLFSTKEAHLGLGLNIARRVALRHGGGVTLETVDGGFRARIVVRCDGSEESSASAPTRDGT